MEVVTGYPIALEMPVLNCPDPPPPPPPPPEMLISTVVPATAKVCPEPTKLSVVKGPDVIEVPAELIPRLNPPVAVMIPALVILLVFVVVPVLVLVLVLIVVVMVPSAVAGLRYFCDCFSFRFGYHFYPHDGLGEPKMTVSRLVKNFVKI